MQNKNENTSNMNRLYFIANTHIATMARPRGGDWLEGDLFSIKKRGIDILVCLMENAELDELLLQNEAEFCKKMKLQFIHFPIADFGLPKSDEEVKVLTLQLKAAVNAGKKIAIHCRMGIGRSSSIAAATLIALGEHTTNTAFEAITEARGLRVPDTEQQIEWVRRFEQRFNCK